MGKRTKYKESHHRRAFELYRELGSFYAVSKEKGMPSHCTLLRWASPTFNCSCKFHGWEALEKRIRAEVKARDEQSGEQDEHSPPLSELEKYIRPDLEKLKINRVIEKQAYDAIIAEDEKERVAPPDTLSEAQKIIHTGWREDRLIRGEPGERVDHYLHFDKEDEEL